MPRIRIRKKKHKQLLSKKSLDFTVTDEYLSTESGLLLFNEFLARIDFDTFTESMFAPRTPEEERREHSDSEIIRQLVLQYASGNLTDESANTFRKSPVFLEIMGKEGASQSTLSRFWNDATPEDIERIQELILNVRSVIFGMKNVQKIVIDLDSTLKATYGRQQGAGYNAHYAQEGYHPLVSFSEEGDLLMVKLRPGTDYCSVGAAELIEDIIQELRLIAPDIVLEFRADSGFAAPEIYSVLERYGVLYAIKLKDNARLEMSAFNPFVHELKNPDFSRSHELFGEFTYAALSWDRDRRVLFTVTRPAGSQDVDQQFIVTNMAITPEEGFRYYRDRGNSENYIKELKDGYVKSLPHKSQIANALHFAVQALAYALMTWFRQLCLPEPLQQATSKTIRQAIMHMPAHITRSGRRIRVKISCHSPYADLYFQTLDKILALEPA